VTSSEVCREPRSLAGFGKPTFKTPKLLRLNAGIHQPHAFASSAVCPGKRDGRADRLFRLNSGA